MQNVRVAAVGQVLINAAVQVLKTGDVIEFYNAVFIPEVKAFILKLGSRKAQLVRPQLPGPQVPGSLRSTPLRPPPNGVAYTPPQLERSLGGYAGMSPAMARVAVSPLRQSPQQALATPRARSLYAARLGEGSTAYQSPSRDLDMINRSLTGRSSLHSPVLGHAAVLQALDPNLVRTNKWQKSSGSIC